MEDPKEIKLKPKDDEILLAMIEGLANKQIAKRLNMALRTIEYHRHPILKAFGANSPAQLGYLARPYVDDLIRDQQQAA